MDVVVEVAAAHRDVDPRFEDESLFGGNRRSTVGKLDRCHRACFMIVGEGPYLACQLSVFFYLECYLGVSA